MNDLFNQPRFNGPDYDPELDDKRLTGQIKRVYTAMIGGGWKTLEEISRETGDPESSISAQLRHLRKDRFGGHIVDKRRRGKPEDGLFEYRLSAQMTHSPEKDPGKSNPELLKILKRNAHLKDREIVSIYLYNTGRKITLEEVKLARALNSQ